MGTGRLLVIAIKGLTQTHKDYLESFQQYCSLEIRI